MSQSIQASKEIELETIIYIIRQIKTTLARTELTLAFVRLPYAKSDHECAHIALPLKDFTHVLAQQDQFQSNRLSCGAFAYEQATIIDTTLKHLPARISYAGQCELLKPMKISKLVLATP